jgi:hypothetical protein
MALDEVESHAPRAGDGPRHPLPRASLRLGAALNGPEQSGSAFGDGIVALDRRGRGESAGTGLGFDVEDASLACRAVVGAGGTVIERTEGRGAERIFLRLVQDAEGNRFSVPQVVR